MTEKTERVTRRKCVFPMSRIKLAEAGEDGKRRFQGYASVFGNRDAHGDVVVKGAFERSLRERPDVKVLWQHDTSKPIGKMEAGHENEFGLVVTAALSDTNFVQGEVLPLLEDGVVNGLSIGYDVKVEEWNEDEETWFLKDIDLFEFSAVTFPANELATVSEVKSLDSTPEDMHAERVQRHSKTLIHEFEGYFKDSIRRDALDLEQIRTLHALLGGTLLGAGTTAADAGGELEFAYLSGLKDGLDLKEYA